MKYIKALILVFIVFSCAGCKLTCVKMEQHENTDNTFRVIINNKNVELNNSYTLNDNSASADNKDKLLNDIKSYLDETYDTESVIEGNTVNMKKVMTKNDTFFGYDLNNFNYFELSKYFEENGYTCR